jgi:hypothetical protein
MQETWLIRCLNRPTARMIDAWWAQNIRISPEVMFKDDPETFAQLAASVARCTGSDRLAPSFVQASMSLLLLLHDLYSCTNIQHVCSTAACQEHDQKVVRAQLKRGPCRTCHMCSCWRHFEVFVECFVFSRLLLDLIRTIRPLRLLLLSKLTCAFVPWHRKYAFTSTATAVR